MDDLIADVAAARDVVETIGEKLGAGLDADAEIPALYARLDAVVAGANSIKSPLALVRQKLTLRQHAKFTRRMLDRLVKFGRLPRRATRISNRMGKRLDRAVDLVRVFAPGFAALQFGRRTEHHYVRDCRFIGPAFWNLGTGFVGVNVVLEDVLNHEGEALDVFPPGPPGVTHR